MGLVRKKDDSMPYWIKWGEMPWEEVNANVSRKVIIRDHMMMVMYRFGPHLTWPEEIHKAEQGGYVIKGKIELSLPSESKRILLKAGDGYLIGSKIPHAWKTLDEEAILIDIFSPPRKELIEKKFAPHAIQKEGLTE